MWLAMRATIAGYRTSRRALLLVLTKMLDGTVVSEGANAERIITIDFHIFKVSVLTAVAILRCKVVMNVGWHNVSRFQ